MGVKEQMENFEKNELVRLKQQLTSVEKELDDTQALTAHLLALVFNNDINALTIDEAEFLKGVSLTMLNGADGMLKIDTDKITQRSARAMTIIKMGKGLNDD